MESEMARDVVCGMEIEKGQAAATVEYEGNWYYFCSEHCKDKFLASPQNYTEQEEG